MSLVDEQCQETRKSHHSPTSFKLYAMKSQPINLYQSKMQLTRVCTIGPEEGKKASFHLILKREKELEKVQLIWTREVINQRLLQMLLRIQITITIHMHS